MYGGAVVKDDAIVCHTACIYDNASLWNSVEVRGSAMVYGNAMILDGVIIRGNVQIFDYARVWGNAMISGSAMVSGYATVFDNAYVKGDTKITDLATISGDAIVRDNSCVKNNAQISGNAIIFENATITGNSVISDMAHIFSDAHCDDVVINGMPRISCKAHITSNRDYIVIGPIGSRSGYTTVYKCIDDIFRIQCGCFNGTIEEFLNKLNETYSESNAHHKTYMAMIKLICQRYQIELS